MNKYIIELHIIKDLLGLDETTYRNMLIKNYGVDTSKKLNNDQLKTIINALKYIYNSDKSRLTYEQYKAIKRLARGKVKHLNNYISKIVRRETRLKELSRKEASLVIRTLKRYHKRDFDMFCQRDKQKNI